MKNNSILKKIIIIVLIVAISFMYVNQAKAAALYRALLIVGYIVGAPLTIIIDYYTCIINALWGGCGNNGDNGGGGGDIQVDVKINDSDGLITVNVPASYILKWSATNVSTCASTWAEGEIGPQGTIQYSNINIPQRIYYTLTCNGVSDTAIVDIIGPEVDLSGPIEVTIPNPLSVNWISNNVTSCQATSSPNTWNGSKSLNGSETIFSETKTNNRGVYNFTLSCSDDNGNTGSDNHTAKIIQIPKCNFSANPTTITPPQTSTLSWNCQYANTCSIDQNIGLVDPISGNQSIRPPETTTYTLTCDGLDGIRSWETTVNVGFAPNIREIIPR